jgi:hypothetical protein
MAQRRARNLPRRLGRRGSGQEVARPRGRGCGGASPTRARSSAARRCAARASSCSSKGTCCPRRIGTFRAGEGARCHTSACARVRTVVSSEFVICAACSGTDAICSNRFVRWACLDFRPEINSYPRAGPDVVSVSRPQRSDCARCGACRFASDTVTACCVAAGGQGASWRQDSAGNIHRGPARGRR